MSALTLYQIEERMQDRRASFGTSSEAGKLRDLLRELLAVLEGSVLPLGSAVPGLDAALRRDLGLD